MACGAPVIASSSGALQEIIGQAAILIDPLDVVTLAGSIRSLLEDGKRRDELIGKGHARAGEFSWEKTAQATYRVYQRIIA